MPPSAPLSLLRVCTELGPKPHKDLCCWNKIQVNFCHLQPRSRKPACGFLVQDLPDHRPAITLSAGKPTAFSLGYTLDVGIPLLCSAQQHQDAENRHMQPNCCGDWLPSSVQMEGWRSFLLRRDLWRAKQVLVLLTFLIITQSLESQRGQGDADFLLNCLQFKVF